MEIAKIGDIEVLVGRDAEYLQVNDISEEKLREILPLIRREYAGFKIMLCYHNSIAPDVYLREISAELVDNAKEMRLSPRSLSRALSEDDRILPENADFAVHLIDEGNFDVFAKFHDVYNPDIYWTSSRIREKPDIWRIHAYAENNKISGFIMVMSDYEVFSVAAANSLQSKRLMAVAAADAFTRGSSQIMYMADKTDTVNTEAASDVGFAECGFYKGYRLPQN